MGASAVPPPLPTPSSVLNSWGLTCAEYYNLQVQVPTVPSALSQELPFECSHRQHGLLLREASGGKASGEEACTDVQRAGGISDGHSRIPDRQAQHRKEMWVLVGMSPGPC